MSQDDEVQEGADPAPLQEAAASISEAREAAAGVDETRDRVSPGSMPDASDDTAAAEWDDEELED